MLITFGSIYICKEEFPIVNFQQSKFCSRLNATRRCYGTLSCFKFHNRHIQDNKDLHISEILLKIVIICKYIGKNIFYYTSIFEMIIPGAVRSRTWVCGRSLAGIVGSNTAEGMDVCLLSVLCCQVQVSALG